MEQVEVKGEAVSCREQATTQLERAIKYGNSKKMIAILNQFPETAKKFQPLKFVISEGVKHDNVIKTLVCHTAHESLDSVLKFCLEHCSPENLTVLSYLLKSGAQCNSPTIISVFLKRHIQNEPLKHKFITTVLKSSQSEIVLGCLLNALVLVSVLEHHELNRPLIEDIIPVVRRLAAAGCSPWALFDRRLTQTWVFLKWYGSPWNDQRKNILPFAHIFAQLIVTTSDTEVLAKYSMAINCTINPCDISDKYCELPAYSAKLVFLMFYASGAWCYPSIQLPAAHRCLWKAICQIKSELPRLQVPSEAPPWKLHDKSIRNLKDICRDSFRRAAQRAPNIAYVLEQIAYPSTLKNFILYSDIIEYFGFHT